MRESQKGLRMVIISGFVYGVMPSAVSFCYSQGATAALVMVLRALALGLVLLPTGLRQRNAAAYRKNWAKLLVLSAVGTGTPLLLLSSYRYLPTGTATTIHFLYPTVVALICVTVFRERLSGLMLLCFALCITGILLMTDAPGERLNAFGVTIALLSSVTWATYIVLLDKFRMHGLTAEQIAFFIGIHNFLLALLYGLATGSLTVRVTPVGWLALLLTGTVVAVFGSMFFTIGVRRTNAQVSAIASTLEPITSLFVGVLFLHEPVSLKTCLGSAMILAAVILLARFNEKTAPPRK